MRPIPGRHIIVGIQHLRGLAAVAVVIYHASRVVGAEWSGITGFELLGASDFGLQLFFVISGFIITIVCLDQNNQPNITRSDFLLRRFVRIIPTMWAAILLYIVLKIGSGDALDWPATLRSVFLWPVGQLKPGQIWTLRLEFTFYLLFAFAVITSRSRLWLIGAWALLPVVSRLAAPHVSWLTPAGSIDNFVWVHLMGHQVGANLQFGAGMILALLWKRQSPVVPRNPRLGFLALLAICLAAVVADEFLARSGLNDVATILVQTAIVSGIVLLAINIKPLDSKPERVGRFLGDASYSIYLFHVLALPVIDKVLQLTKVAAVLPAPAQFVVLTLLSVAAGGLAYLLVERPLVRAVGAWVGSGRRSPGARRHDVSGRRDIRPSDTAHEQIRHAPH